MAKKKNKNHQPKDSSLVKKIQNFFAANWPIFTLLFISLVLCFLNFDSGTFLTGWDNLHPEFNIKLDLQRTLFSVWQEYRGTGLLTGMAHAADLPRLILIYLLNLVKTPTNLIRYFTTFLPLVVGPIGTYLLIKEILQESKQTEKTIKTGAFLSALYYIFNLSTLQTFFIPFETFTWLYGSLPFLILSILRYLKRPKISNLLFIFFVSFLSGTAFYVETIFIVFMLCLAPFFIEFLANNRFKIKHFSSSVLGFISLIIPQIYWLAPIIFFVKNNASFSVLNRINIISSPETYYRNLEFGNLQNIFLLKGYLFKYLDLGLNEKYSFLLSTWKNHLEGNLFTALGYIFFIIIGIGIYYSVKEKLTYSKSFLAILALCYFFLLGGGLLINNTIPLIGELLRSPFTKFSIPLSLAYSYFFAIGVIFLLDIFSFLDTKLTYYFTFFTCTFLLVAYMSPAFSGNLISKSMRVSIPNEYFELFGYLQKQPADMRIANFPQHTFWGWNYYSWPARRGGGYRGSGFLWYGIKQPILDRAFDVWEKTSESYYEELSTALYSQNQKDFDSVIDKYNVGYLFIDKSIIAPDTKADLGLNYLDSMIKDNPQYTLEKTFGEDLLLYKNNNFKSENFLSITPVIANLAEGALQQSTTPILNFNLRPNQNWYEKAGYLNTNIVIANRAEGDLQQSTTQELTIPSLSETEKLLPYKIDFRKNPNSISLRFTPTTPVFFLNKKQIDLKIKPQIIEIPISSSAKKLILDLNSQYFPIDVPSEVENFDGFFPITEIYLPTQNNFDLGLYDGIPTEQLPLINSLANAVPKQCYYEPKNSSVERKIEKILSPRSITMLGTDIVACLSTSIPQIGQNQLLGISFTYYSPTLTTANVNVTDETFSANNPSQPLDPSNTPKRSQLFTKPSPTNKQINLILEASETKSIQEITYKDVYLSTHTPLLETKIGLNKIEGANINLQKEDNTLQISLPITKTQFDIAQISASNSLFPEDRNCDQFNKGETVKQVNSDHILYQSRDAIQCDFLNLRHFDHSLNYLIGIDAQKNKGLSLTTCLENHTTRRCDVYERLGDAKSTQYILQPITNPSETPGYTLHLFNQSLGNRITENRLNSISIHPFPLNFLQSISLSLNADSADKPAKRADNAEITSSTHPAEFIYTLTLPSVIARNDSDAAIYTNQLNLYQTKSEYWKAIVLPESYKNLNPWQLTLKILLNYKSLPKLQTENCNPLSTNCYPIWYNSFVIPAEAGIHQINSTVIPDSDPESTFIAIIYIPQYLEFFGFGALLIYTLILLSITFIKQFKPHKKASK